jgi:hypothetical protein
MHSPVVDTSFIRLIHYTIGELRKIPNFLASETETTVFAAANSTRCCAAIPRHDLWLAPKLRKLTRPRALAAAFNAALSRLA